MSKETSAIVKCTRCELTDRDSVEKSTSPEVTWCPCCGCKHAMLVVVCPDCKEETCYNGPHERIRNAAEDLLAAYKRINGRKS